MSRFLESSATCRGHQLINRTFAAALTILLSSSVDAQQLLKVSQTAWLELTAIEREFIQKTYVVQLAESNAFGVIIDNQGVNESTPGTTGGAVLGGAIGNAAYVDKALKSGNYSAKNQLAAEIAGVILGSAIDSKPNTQFHYRYAVKLGSGNIEYFDQVKGDAFRHPVGVCVSVPNISLIDQQICTQTAAMLRAAYLPPSPTSVSGSAPTPGLPPTSLNVPVASIASITPMPIQVGDTVWVSNGAVNGYQAPSISAKRVKEFPDGTPLEVEVIMKDFVKVRDAKGLLLWVERRGVVGAAPQNRNIAASPQPPPIVTQEISATIDSQPSLVNCKLGTLAPVRTSAEKCALIKGSEVQ